MSLRPELKIDWATAEAARYACEKWHYSKTVPVGKTIRIGAWEDNKFIGVVLFAWGMNKSLGSPYGLLMTECCELVRIAMSVHKTEISRIVSIALRFLKKKSQGLRLVVSFADPQAGHHGGIYQAGNWVYTGATSQSFEYRIGDRRLNKRAYTGVNFNGKARSKIPNNAKKFITPGKHRYLMPLDDEIRLRIEPLRKPYPKRAGSSASGMSDIQSEGGGANPTPALPDKTQD